MHRGPVYLVVILGVLLVSTGVAYSSTVFPNQDNPVPSGSDQATQKRPNELIKADTVESPVSEGARYDVRGEDGDDGNEGSQMLFEPDLERSSKVIDPNRTVDNDSDLQVVEAGDDGSTVKQEGNKESVISFNFLYYLLQKFESKDN